MLPDPRESYPLPFQGGELILVRHGQSVANARGIAQGRADYALSERGREQARMTAEALAAVEGIHAIYASPLSRAFETAQFIASRLSMPVTAVEDLVELDVGQLSGKTMDELRAEAPEAIAHYEAALATSDHPRNRELIPGWEPIERIVARIWKAIAGIAQAHPTERVVIVSHGGVLNAFQTHLLAGDARETPWRYASTNCAISRIVLAPGGPEPSCLVDDTHLAALATGRTVFDPVPNP